MMLSRNNSESDIHFMGSKELSFGTDLWDGFSVVSRWTQHGMGMCKEMCEYLRRRAKIEEKYSHSLSKLITKTKQEEQDLQCTTHYGESFAAGSLGSAWESMKHTTLAQAAVHATLAAQLKDKMGESINKTNHLEEQLKQAVSEGQKLVSEREQWVTSLKKLKKKSLKPGPEGQAAENSFLNHVAQSNFFMQNFYNELMPRVLSRLENTERVRQQMVQSKFIEFSQLLRDVPTSFLPHAQSLCFRVEQIDINKDINDFILKHKSIPPKQDQLANERETPKCDEVQKKNFKTWARKVNANIFGTYKTMNMKSSANLAFPPSPPPASPYSLSPPSPPQPAAQKLKISSVFARSVDDIMKEQKEIYPNLEIPYFIVVLAREALKSNATQLEGIFRVAAPSVLLARYAELFDRGEYSLPEAQAPFITTNLLKKWFRDLAEPLIPTFLYEKCIGTCFKSEVCTIVGQLPCYQKKLIIFMARLLQEFANVENSKSSKMDSANLAMVFSPSFLRCNSPDMSRVLLNVQKEKLFVQALIDYFEGERVKVEDLEGLIVGEQKLVSLELFANKWLMPTKPEGNHEKGKGELAMDEKERFRENLKKMLIKRVSENELLYHRQQQAAKHQNHERAQSETKLDSSLPDNTHKDDVDKAKSMVAHRDLELLKLKRDLEKVAQEKRNLEVIAKAKEETARRRRSRTVTDSEVIARLDSGRKNPSEFGKSSLKMTTDQLEKLHFDNFEVTSARRASHGLSKSALLVSPRRHSGFPYVPDALLSSRTLLSKVKQNMELTKVLAISRVTSFIQRINETVDYSLTIDISKVIKALLKCLDNSIAKLSLTESQVRMSIETRPILPNVIIRDDIAATSEASTRLRKLREILIISIDKIVDKICGLAGRIKIVSEAKDVAVWEVVIEEIRNEFVSEKPISSSIRNSRDSGEYTPK